MVTDPPYGVDFSGSKTTKATKRKANSDTYIDTNDNFHEVILPAIALALAHADRAAIFSGIRRLDEYPKASDIGGIVYPNGAGRSPWGFCCYNPVLFYGKRPRIGGGPTATVMYNPGETNIDHPCPKPIKFMTWTIETASLKDQTVLDPFMGSGTTGVACVQLERRFIGIELEPKYFDIACRRIDQELKKPSFFTNKPKRTKVEGFFSKKKRV